MINPTDILNDYLKGNYKNNINEEIARYFIVYLADIHNLKLAEVAEKCHVSTSTVIRFCREIGFLDFTDFKKCVQASNIANKTERYRKSFSKSPKDLKFYRDRIFERNNKIMYSITRLDINKIDKLANDIFHYKYVYILGQSLSTLVGEYMRIQLVGLDKNVITLSSPKMDIPLSPSKKDTLGIVITQCNNYFQDGSSVISYLQDNCDNTWLITKKNSEENYDKYFHNTLFIDHCEDMIMGYHLLLNISEIIVEYCSKNYE